MDKHSKLAHYFGYMYSISTKTLVLSTIVALVVFASGQTPSPERDYVLKQIESRWGAPHIADEAVEFPGFRYDLRVTFDGHGTLIAAKGSSHKKNLKGLEYQEILERLNAIKPLGKIQKTDSRWSWGMNTMTARIDRYESAITDRCETGRGRSRGVDWFQVLYLHPVKGEITSITRPHGRLEFDCKGFDGKAAVCEDMETPDWELTDISVGEDLFLIRSNEASDLKVGDKRTLQAFGPLDRVCGAL